MRPHLHLRLILPILAVVLGAALLAQGQGSVRTFDTLTALLALNPKGITSGGRASVVVLGKDAAGDWGPSRTLHYSDASTAATNLGNCWAPFTGVGRWIADDAAEELQDPRWWGARPGLGFDSGPAFRALLTWTNSIRLPVGKWATSYPLRWSNALPRRIVPVAGSYQGGWHSTNAVTKAEIVYIGAPTAIAFDFTPTNGLCYGIDLGRVSFNANRLADVCVKIKSAGRWTLDHTRANGATGAQLLVEASQFGEAYGFSTSVNDDTPAQTPAAYGVVLTNWAVVNTFVNPIIEGGTNFGVLLTANSWNNHFINGASEKLGGGIKLDDNARYNRFETQWQETNAVEVSWLYVGTNCFHNRFSSFYQNEAGRVDVHGSYNRFESSLLGRITVHTNGSRNTWSDIILRVDGSWTDETHGQQTIQQMVNAAATWRTNSFPDPITFYGSQLSLWNADESYPRSIWSRTAILFGDGSADPVAGWSLLSANTISTPNTLALTRSGANDGLFYAAVAGEPFGRVRWNVNSQIDLGGGSSDYDTWIKRKSSRTIQSNAEWQVLSTNLWTIWSGAYFGESVARTTMRVDGRWEIGDGTSRDVAIGRATNRVAYLEGALDLLRTNTPPAPPAAWGRIYAITDGSGKGRLVVVWPSGTTNAIAIEP